MSEWISVDDELPIDQDYKSTYLSCQVIVTDGINVYQNTYEIGGNHIGKPWGKFTEDEFDEITHWMPLPEPPK